MPLAADSIYAVGAHVVRQRQTRRDYPVHAGGSGIGSVAIKMAKALGCTVITTVGDDTKAEKPRHSAQITLSITKPSASKALLASSPGRKVSTSSSST